MGKNKVQKTVLIFIGVIFALIVYAKASYKKPDVSPDATERTTGHWIYTGSCMNASVEKEQQNTYKAYIDELVERWMNKKVTDDELAEWMTQYLKKQNIEVQAIGVMSRQKCLFESEKEVPDYKMRMQESESIYEFAGLYTENERTEEGKLICYYWEAGAR